MIKSKKMSENVFHDIQIYTKEANNSEDTTINLESVDKIILVLNKCNPDNFIVLTGKELFPKDRDIYFVVFDGTPYKAKKETFEFIECFGMNTIKAEFERIKEEGEQ